MPVGSFFKNDFISLRPVWVRLGLKQPREIPSASGASADRFRTLPVYEPMT